MGYDFNLPHEKHLSIRSKIPYISLVSLMYTQNIRIFRNIHILKNKKARRIRLTNDNFTHNTYLTAYLPWENDSFDRNEEYVSTRGAKGLRGSIEYSSRSPWLCCLYTLPLPASMYIYLVLFSFFAFSRPGSFIYWPLLGTYFLHLCLA